MKTRERYNLEFKEEISRSFLKTVSAFANYSDGEIIFGIENKGKVLGMNGDLEKVILKIEHMINDSITPVPHFEITLKEIDNKKIIIVEIKKGKDTPYYYKGKAYKRSDTSTVEVDRFELRRLAMEGSNMNYEDRKSSSKELNFKVLEAKLKKEAGIERINLDILKTLNLYNKDGYYNIAGELLADQNDIAFSGIDIIKFGKDINKILYRKTINNVSLLTQLDSTIDIFEQYYVYEEINDYNRINKELIPKEAFREALANAIVHRVWDTNSYIQIAMSEDKIEINSPGGLPEGISEDEYLYGNISVLRNPIIAGVFNRLNIIEKFGTGIARINKEYVHSISKPNFEVSENRIKIILPITKIDQLDLSKDESRIYELLKTKGELSRKDIDLKTGYDKSKSLRILNTLVEKNIIIKLGSGRAITYRLK
jgi:ATP-dependent DNA helicase RecG